MGRYRPRNCWRHSDPEKRPQNAPQITFYLANSVIKMSLFLITVSQKNYQESDLGGFERGGPQPISLFFTSRIINRPLFGLPEGGVFGGGVH